MHRLAASLLALATLSLSAADDPAAIVAKLTPAAGWTASEPARTAAGDDLFDLIDGGAELYHEYGFKRAVSWQLETAARASIQVEIYEMVDAPAAYGVLSLMQTGKFATGPLGQGSLRFGYYVAFWSGPYYASVTGAQSDPATQAEVDRLATQLAALLPHDGALPAWLDLAPAAGLQTRKYFRGRISLSNITAGPADDLFNPREGLVAEYADARLLLLHSASAEAASALLAAAAGQAAPLTGLVREADGFAGRTADGAFIVARQHAADLFVATGADQERCRALAAAR